MTDDIYAGVAGNSFTTPVIEIPTPEEGYPTVNYSVFADELSQELPGAAVEAMKVSLRATIRDFCTRSGAWMRLLAPVDLVADKAEYQLKVDDAEILYIHRIGFYNTNDTSKEPDDLGGLVNGFDRFILPSPIPQSLGRASMTASGAPQRFVGNSELNGYFRLVPKVNVDVPKSMYPYVSLAPKIADTSEEISASLVRFHFDKILDGTLGRMMLQSKKNYSNPAMGAYHMRRYNNSLGTARDMARRQFTDAENSFLYPRWA